MIVSIKFPSVWQDAPMGTPFATVQRSQTVEFKLGLGPCGKTVTGLKTDNDREFFYILQSHDDGTHKRFMYRLCQIVGRIEVELAA
ncbi:hypothetical protein [Sphingobium sp. CCH11-B1]|uniref:hypothetical protein n=1 Tax=Sphingobium sp. CCH11-B1 TaxID=1768781 RepID=UPI00082B0C5E